MFRVEKPGFLDLSWEALEGMLKGISAIDTNQMTVKDVEEAEQFILKYGYDMQNDEDRAELRAIQDEAISFIERRFLDLEIPWQDIGEEPLSLKVPYVLRMDETPNLLLTASNGNTIEQRWACAILKVMHTISHINNAILYRYFEAAKSQIIKRYNGALTQNKNGELLLGTAGEMTLSIAGFEIKDEKSRDSMILKLLCKRENVAEEVFDMIGIRIITHTAAEAIMALEILRLNKIIIFPNIIPSRSRNSLIDFDEFKVQYEEACEGYQWGENSLKETLRFIENIATETPPETFNPNNSSTLATYRSIHITERQLIRFTLPGTEAETRFFFPYEIQLVDEASFLENHSGSSAHALYKQSQLIQARRRVLGPLFIALRKQNHRADKNLEPGPLP